MVCELLLWEREKIYSVKEHAQRVSGHSALCSIVTEFCEMLPPEVSLLPVFSTPAEEARMYSAFNKDLQR